MIDVVFLLLVFFLLTARFMAAEDQLSSGLASKRGPPSDLEPQVISIAYVEGVPVYSIGDRSVNTQSELTAILRDLPPEAGAIVRAAPDTPWRYTMAAMQACEDAGLRSRSYAPR